MRKEGEESPSDSDQEEDSGQNDPSHEVEHEVEVMHQPLTRMNLFEIKSPLEFEKGPAHLIQHCEGSLEIFTLPATWLPYSYDTTLPENSGYQAGAPANHGIPAAEKPFTLEEDTSCHCDIL